MPLTRRKPGRPGRTLLTAAVTGLLVSAAALPGAWTASAASSASAAASTAKTALVNGPNFLNLPAPLTGAGCETAYGVTCYTLPQLRDAYDLNPLYARGITGRGRTIVVAVPFGSPTIRQDLATFDRHYGLPDPNLRIVQFGDVPPYDPTDPWRVEWAAGTTLQVEYAHAIAPGANIVLAETAVSETEGTVGFPELMNAEQSLIDAGVGDVITQIEAAAENTFPGFGQGDYSSIRNLRYAYKDAYRHRVTVLAVAGDYGVVNTESDGATPYPYPTVNWPASDPLVTAVTGIQMYLNGAGAHMRPDTTWSDGYGTGAGGLSSVFSRPGYQNGVAGVVGDHRGLPDITLNGAVDGGVWGYASFGGTGGQGWDLFDGSAEAMSTFAGIVALADQVAGHRLGLLNPALYRLGRCGGPGLVDITRGNNGFNGVAGYNAGPGYDLASGWGTIDAAAFVPALARLG